ncbi:DUF2586 domain-containing protein [Tissierella carlieri]|uniref:DUF2586 domain-containing protein n=1 Tax=Tissierella carlieri TaxID=689904 RepID=A0ABT1SC70_9FIRM|nr:DUF2586 domain-containing protein [Tissierella carlieri]MCQ4924086.1 DUF2586 domain-containing protein [Tissierella carlieri]
MLRDVRHEITDGLLGLSTTKGEGVHVKIGVSPIVSDTPIIITGNMTAAKIKERLGLSPLADKVMDSVENGSARVICFPVSATTAGTIGAISSGTVGSGSLKVTGSPYNAFDISIKITGQGGLNAASFVYSIDGGRSYSDEATVPMNGVFVIEDTGLTVTFEVLEGQKFNVDDVFTFKTTAPQMTNGDALKAIEKLKTFNEEFEFVHIVGESNAELWAAVSAQQVILANQYHKPMFFVLEAYNIAPNEKVEDYAFRLEAEKKLIKNYDVQVVAARSLYTGMDGITREINNAGIVAGMYAKAKVNQSIGETAVFGISVLKMKELRPLGIEEYIEVLDAANYLTFRQYDGLEGFYVTNARMMCPDGSDYRYAEDVRVKNKIIKKTRKEALLQLQSDVDMEDVDGDLAAKGKFIQAPLEDMVKDKEISSVSINVPEGQDILVTETMHIIIRYVPRGKIREIVIDLGVSNPNAK